MVDFETRARAFVHTAYPLAIAAFLGGSAASGEATESSDLDIVVVLPDEWEQASFVETSTFEGQLVEAFVYGQDALQAWLNKGRLEARPVLDRLIGHGVPLVDSDVADTLAAASRAVLAAGPEPCDPLQLGLRRYSLSALVDDLEAPTDSGVRTVLMATAWREAAELALLSVRCWLGTGKWLLRETRSDGDRFGLASWADDGGFDSDALGKICRAVLASQGGYLQAGFVRGEKPAGL